MTPPPTVTMMEWALDHTEFPRHIRAKLVESPSGCWEWIGKPGNALGHARTSLGGESVWLHRATWERLVGPIPEGLEIDHVVCDNPRCCNPAHLRVCTHLENILRAAARRPDHCPQGHPYDEANTGYQGDAHRFCRECRRIQASIRYWANRDAINARARAERDARRGGPITLQGHGTRACFRRGCRCDECAEANRTYSRRKQAQRTITQRERRRRTREANRVSA